MNNVELEFVSGLKQLFREISTENDIHGANIHLIDLSKMIEEYTRPKHGNLNPFKRQKTSN
jgi:hypothetical protein